MISGYLILLAATIGILGLSMVWQLQSFEQNLSRLSLPLPAPSQIPSLNVTQELQKITDQAASETTGTEKEYATPDKAVTFSYSPLWQQSQSGPLQQGQGTTIFSASRINISQISIAYLTVTQFTLTDKNDIIEQLKDQVAGKIKVTITDDGPLTVKGGTAEILEAVYDLGVANQPQVSSLNAKIAIISLPDKSYIVSVYGSAAAWDSLKPEADVIFKSIQITAPASQTKKTPVQQ